MTEEYTDFPRKRAIVILGRRIPMPQSVMMRRTLGGTLMVGGALGFPDSRLLDAAARTDRALARFPPRPPFAPQKRSAHLAQMAETWLRLSGRIVIGVHYRNLSANSPEAVAKPNISAPPSLQSITIGQYRLLEAPACRILPGVKRRYLRSAVVRWLWLEKFRRAAISLIGISVSRKHRSASSSRNFKR